MGRWMCEHAMTKGFAATVYNRSADKAQPLVDQGLRGGAALLQPRRLGPLCGGRRRRQLGELVREGAQIVVERCDLLQRLVHDGRSPAGDGSHGAAGGKWARG